MEVSQNHKHLKNALSVDRNMFQQKGLNIIYLTYILPNTILTNLLTNCLLQSHPQWLWAASVLHKCGPSLTKERLIFYIQKLNEGSKPGLVPKTPAAVVLEPNAEAPNPPVAPNPVSVKGCKNA